MDQDITYGILGVSSLVVVVSMLMLRRPYTPGRPSLVPWNGVLFASLMVAVMSAVHSLSLAGWKP